MGVLEWKWWMWMWELMDVGVSERLNGLLISVYTC